MATLTLQYEDRILKAYPLAPMTTIGRLSDNAVVVDNPAVSSHHACVFCEGNDFIIEDLQSTNGTFVNGTRVIRQPLHHGDVVVVGQHKLVFDRQSTEDSTPAASTSSTSDAGETVFLDLKQNQRLRGIVMNAEARAKEAATMPSRVGVLRVIDGSTDREEYLLEGHTSLIGRASWTLIRLKGWFKPGVAVAITRNHQGYVVTRLRGRLLVNDHTMNGRHDLKEGDILEVGGLTLAFRFEDSRQSAADGDATSVVDPAAIDRSNAAGIGPQQGAVL